MKRLAAAGQTHSPLYLALTASDEQLVTTQALPQQGAVVVQPAVDATQVAPQTARNTMLGIGLGILLAVGAAFLAEALDTRVRSSGEVSRLLHAPILAEVPAQGRPLPRSQRLTAVTDASTPAAERIRMLRTSFDLARKESGTRTVMFSDVGRERQSATTVGDLAVALARSGRDVVLCDFDSRSRSLGDLFHINGRPGVSDVAAGRAALQDVLVPVALSELSQDGESTTANGSGRLRFLPLGPHVAGNPGDFVGQPAVAETLAELTRSADLVLVQVPPLLEVSDAMALSESVDGIVLLTDLSDLERDRVAAVERMLDATSTPVLGIVVFGSRAS